ncbi:hypothetical protein BIFPSEUDO_03089 [Bifidobacterium pseudocatenulatum DSM 20438 = JCM 1200 = LMG 10505]|uniref:Uncharacterized protein n=1 Tax=Bifidobacterium pseudocatenulatum DSM 20438 = JCM 1200 = LMG 10505 TaxID=547043 RepID=C0BSH0_BIFPS|nr:hypothetical protein BIFPSEUDO_03089 [Bifidobacterium pseudocatenulatum DSM 20438 = JCM 1200 = LMG 10505]
MAKVGRSYKGLESHDSEPFFACGSSRRRCFHEIVYIDKSHDFADTRTR